MKKATQVAQGHALGAPETSRTTTAWVQTERAAHEAWFKLTIANPKAGALLHALVVRMGHQNAVVVSQKTLARLLGCSVRTVQNALSVLVEGRWVEVVRLNGPGTVAAYVVNSRVAWGQRRDQLSLSVFSASVVADLEDQDQAALAGPALRRIPLIFEGERQVPAGPGEDPPAQAFLDGLEPDLPARSTD